MITCVDTLCYNIGEVSLGGGGIGESVVSSIDTEGLDALRFRNNFLQVYNHSP